MVAVSRLTVGLSLVTASLAVAIEIANAPPQKRGPFDFVMGLDHPISLALRNKTRRSTDYDQDYTTGGTVDFSPGNGEFYVDWDTTDDFVVGVGWTTGTTSPITHSGSFDVTSGLASLSVYGWTTNPLVEYYIIEEMVNIDQSGTQKGTVYSDGATYTIWENQRVDAPSIQGTTTFNQYISIRSSARTSGTVTVENHFKAWADLGMNLGTMNYQVIAVESWDGSGNCYQTVSN